MSTFTKSEDPDEMQHNMLHLIRVYIVCKGKKDLQTKKKEFDSPQTLLADTKGVFYGMAKDAGLVF